MTLAKNCFEKKLMMIKNALISCYIFMNGLTIMKASDPSVPAVSGTDNQETQEVASTEQASETPVISPIVDNAPSVEPGTTTKPPVTEEEFCDEIKLAAKDSPNPVWKMLGMRKRKRLLFCSTKSGWIRLYTPEKARLLMEQQIEALQDDPRVKRMAQLRAALHL